MTGFSKKELRSSGFAANPSESLCHCVTSPLWKRGTNHQPAAHPTANLRRLRRHRRALKGRRLSVQYRRQLRPGSKVLCRTFAFQGRRLTNSSIAAIGILKTLSPNRAIDSARGSFLGKELPTGLRLAEGSAAKPPDLKSIFETPVIVIYLGDFSTHRSCSDFTDRFT